MERGSNPSQVGIGTSISQSIDTQLIDEMSEKHPLAFLNQLPHNAISVVTLEVNPGADQRLMIDGEDAKATEVILSTDLGAPLPTPV